MGKAGNTIPKQKRKTCLIHDPSTIPTSVITLRNEGVFGEPYSDSEDKYDPNLAEFFSEAFPSLNKEPYITEVDLYEESLKPRKVKYIIHKSIPKKPKEKSGNGKPRYMIVPLRKDWSKDKPHMYKKVEISNEFIPQAVNILNEVLSAPEELDMWSDQWIFKESIPPFAYYDPVPPHIEIQYKEPFLSETEHTKCEFMRNYFQALIDWLSSRLIYPPLSEFEEYGMILTEKPKGEDDSTRKDYIFCNPDGLVYSMNKTGWTKIGVLDSPLCPRMHGDNKFAQAYHDNFDKICQKGVNFGYTEFTSYYHFNVVVAMINGEKHFIMN